MMKSILIADDDSAIRASLGQVLVQCGHNVTFATDGLAAQACLLNGRFDLLVLDLDMPVRDGWDVLDDLATINPLLPVIVLTGMMDQLSSFEFDGVDALMCKPVDVETLLATIDRLLAHGSKRTTTSAPDQGFSGKRHRSHNSKHLKNATKAQDSIHLIRTQSRCV